MTNNIRYVNLIWLGFVGAFIGVFIGVLKVFNWDFIFLVIFIVVIICLIAFLHKKLTANNSAQNSQRQSTPQRFLSPSNQTRNNFSLTQRSLQNIQWTEIGTYSSNNSQTTEENNITFDDFIDLHDATANTKELINNLIGQKDRVTGDIFNPGEKVYFCVPCQLGYHQDSWRFLDRKCEQCKSPHASKYTLTVSRVSEQPLDTSNPSLT